MMRPALTDQQTIQFLTGARENIAQAMAIVRKISRHDPELAKIAVPRLRRLAAKQERLEAKVRGQQGPSDLGVPFLVPLIIGGMSLLGVGGWVFKHHKETSLERYKLESINKCIEENVNAGMPRVQASEICRGLFTGKDLTDVFAELSKTILIASIAITGVYLFVRWKK